MVARIERWVNWTAPYPPSITMTIGKSSFEFGEEELMDINDYIIERERVINPDKDDALTHSKEKKEDWYQPENSEGRILEDIIDV